MKFGKRSTPRSGVAAVIVVALAAGGLAYEMAMQSQSLVTAAAAASGLSASLMKRIETDANTPIGGNSLGSVTITEFFDYRCPYCRMMEPTLDAVVGQDRRVRLVFKEWPIFGGASVEASRVALAAQWQGKYVAVHRALFSLPRAMDDAAIRQAAAGAGVDMTRLDSDMATRGKEIDAALATVDSEARRIGFQGTPGFVIGNIVAPGAIPKAEMTKLIDDAARK